MIDSAWIRNVDGLHECEINTLIYPLHDFDVQPVERNNLDRRKSQEPGLWPTRSSRDQMSIHMEGDIFGTDSEDYFTNRKALIAALYGDPNIPPDLEERKYGDFDIELAGASEIWTCEFTIEMFSAPVQGLSPSHTTFALTLVSWTPWFVGKTTGSREYYS